MYYRSIKLTYYEVYNFERAYINKTISTENMHPVAQIQLQAEAEINKYSIRL
jgi:hypothetical protein